MRKRKLFSLLALVAALSLVAAACGGDEEEPGVTGPTGVTATGPTAPAVDCDADPFGCVEVSAGEPIRLGSLLTISGDVAFLGTDSNHGIELAIARPVSSSGTTSSSSRRTTAAQPRAARPVRRRSSPTRRSWR